MRGFCIFIALFILTNTVFGQKKVVMASPDGNIEVIYYPEKVSYEVRSHKQPVLGLSKMGIVRKDADFSRNLEVIKVLPPALVTDKYDMKNAKKHHIEYKAFRTVIETRSASGKRMNIVFQLSNDGLGFRYEFPERDNQIHHIVSEATTFHFYDGTRGWLQPKAEAQTGFEHTNPSYEAHYVMDKPLDAFSYNKNGWIYPALFKIKDTWILITEAGLGRTYCGTALQVGNTKSEYKINFPEPAERIPGAALLPESKLPWETPWRIIALGSLKVVSESTLGTDLAAPAKLKDTRYVEPGKAAWSWILKKDAGTVFGVQKQYIDFAADMHWNYCLIDAGWDKSIGYDSVKILADYAQSKKVGLLLWYNSAGNWNTVKFTPRDRLLTHKNRMDEFSKLERMGIKGIKVDFFGGDGQSMINYYQDILEDAATCHLLVNFHGATLPRGLQRTYPNFITAEAVLGYEMITFGQDNADAAPAHMVMCAFARNAFDPMDFTPMNLYKIPHIKRATTSAFELATAVVFLSGIQHYAASPEGLSHVPAFVREFLRSLPAYWEDVRFISGYPGKSYVVARRSGNTWYVSGINGQNKAKVWHLDLSFLKGRKGKIIASAGTDDRNAFQQKNIAIPEKGILDVAVKGNDGFTAVFN